MDFKVVHPSTHSFIKPIFTQDLQITWSKYLQILREELTVCLERKEVEPTTVANIIIHTATETTAKFWSIEVGVTHVVLNNWGTFLSGYAIQVRP